MDECKPLGGGASRDMRRWRRRGVTWTSRAMCPAAERGRAMQVDPIKPTLKAPGIEHLTLKYDKLLSICLHFAFKSNQVHGQ